MHRARIGIGEKRFEGDRVHGCEKAMRVSSWDAAVGRFDGGRNLEGGKSVIYSGPYETVDGSSIVVLTCIS